MSEVVSRPGERGHDEKAVHATRTAPDGGGQTNAMKHSMPTGYGPRAVGGGVGERAWRETLKKKDSQTSRMSKVATSNPCTS